MEPSVQDSDTKPDGIDISAGKCQQHLSELFRVALCRKDDYNLAITSILKQFKKKFDKKSKMLEDMTQREEDR